MSEETNITEQVSEKIEELKEEQSKDISTEVMSTENSNEFVNENGVVISRRDLSDDEINQKKIQLLGLKISLDKAEVDLMQLEKQLEEQIPLKTMEDDIARIDKAIAEKKVKDEDLTETDIKDMLTRKAAMEEALKRDLPMRELRLKIAQIRDSINSPNSPTKQIKVLEKQIRERSENYVTGSRRVPVGVA